MREDDKLNKSGVLKHVKEIISKLGSVSDKMSNILEYHQALGLVPLPELDQRSLTLKRQLSLDQVKVIFPLKCVSLYRVLFLLETDAIAKCVYIAVQYWTSPSKFSLKSSTLGRIF